MEMFVTEITQQHVRVVLVFSIAVSVLSYLSLVDSTCIEIQ